LTGLAVRPTDRGEDTATVEDAYSGEVLELAQSWTLEYIIRLREDDEVNGEPIVDLLPLTEEDVRVDHPVASRAKLNAVISELVQSYNRLRRLRAGTRALGTRNAGAV
jgi:hypothetical protein